MYRDVTDRLVDVCEALRSIVRETSTRDIVVHIAPYLYEERHSNFYQLELSSPFRQFRILAGMLAEAVEPSAPVPLTTLRRHRLLGSLQALPEVLDTSYQPETRFERYADTNAETQTFFVRHLTHIQHFDAISASTIQLIERLFNVVQWHPNELSTWLGFKANKLFHLLHETVRRSVPGALDALLGLSWAATRAEGPIDPSVYHRVDIDEPIELAELNDDVIFDFQCRFMLVRGILAKASHDVLDQRYASEHPFLMMDHHEIYAPPPKYLIESLLDAIMSFERESFPATYAKKMGVLLEQQTHRAFARHFGEKQLFRDVKIGAKQRQKDHIISAGRTVLCVESKGVKLNEIDRNTRHGYMELRNNFSRSIYDALEQAQDAAHHLREMAVGKTVKITGKGVSNLIIHEEAAFTHVAITDANYGMLAMDLHSLRDDVPRPSVAMSAFELEMISDCISWRGWHGSALAIYLEERAALADVVKSPDEMGLAAVFMKNGSLRSLLSSAKGSAIVHAGVDYIGALYMAWLTKSDAPLEGFNIRDLSVEEQEIMSSRAPSSYRAAPRQRSEACPCASGKSFEDCHGAQHV